MYVPLVEQKRVFVKLVWFLVDFKTATNTKASYEIRQKSN